MKVDTEKLRRLRKAKRLTLEEVSHALGYKTMQGYRYIESGRIKMKADQLPALAGIYGVTMDELFTDSK